MASRARLPTEGLVRRGTGSTAVHAGSVLEGLPDLTYGTAAGNRLDTNLLVYAHRRDAKRLRSRVFSKTRDSSARANTSLATPPLPARPWARAIQHGYPRAFHEPQSLLHSEARVALHEKFG